MVKNTGRRRFIGSYLPFSAAVWVDINKFGSLKVPRITGSIRSIFSKPLYYGGNPVIRRRWKVWAVLLVLHSLPHSVVEVVVARLDHLGYQLS